MQEWNQKSQLFVFCHKKKLRGVGKVYPVSSLGWKRLIFKTEKGEMAGLRHLHLFQIFMGTGENIGTKASEGTLRNTMNSFVVNGYQSFSLWLFLCNFHKRGYIYLDSDLEKILLGWAVMSFWLALM